MIDTEKLSNKAQEAFDKRNYDYAIDLTRQILELNPSDSQARKILRSSLVKKCEVQKSQPSPYISFIIGFISVVKVLLFSLLKKYDRVLQSGEEFLSKNPFSLWGRYAVGNSLEQLNYVDSAIEEFESLLTLNPSDIRAMKSLGRLYRNRKDMKKSVHYYQMVLSLKPTDMETGRALKDLAALTTLHEGGWSSAKSSRDIVKDTTTAQQLERESQFVKDSEIPQEINRLNDTINQNPSNPENVKYYKKIGELQTRIKDYNGAIATYEEAIKLAPSDASISMKVGDIKILLFDEKIKEIQQKLKAEPANQSLRDSLGKIQQERNNFRIEENQQRVKLYPTNLSYRYQLGKALFDAKHYDQATAEFQASLRDYKLKIDSLNYLGLCFIAKKHFDLAIAQFTKALENTSLTAEFTKTLRYNLALAYEHNHNYEQALSEYKRILEVDINYRDVSDRINKLQQATK
ncbi:MAG: tetratricopeptide repeat protein [Planctomycetota bacterium]|nr:tetratricopeptide repeat protein [Planctomycetota bacterium]MDI6787874.1 tetratricopeptide repeat protein [Planctomycetota bacterium]